MYMNELYPYPQYTRRVIKIHRVAPVNSFDKRVEKVAQKSNEGLKADTSAKRRLRRLSSWGPFTFIYLFMENSSIHGFNHLTTKRRHIIEHLLWLVTMILGVYGLITISWSTLTRFIYNPTVISLEKNYKDWNTTFPAATICLDLKYDEDSLEKVLTEQLKIDKSDSKAMKEAENFLKILADSNYSSFNLIPDFLKIPPSAYLDAVVNMRAEVDFVATSSVPLEVEESVLNVNEMGICHSYNSRVAIYLNPLSWKSGDYNHSSTRSVLVGSVLDGDILTQLARIPSGYKVFLHSPDEVPDISLRPGIAYEGSYMALEVKALTITSTQAVRQLSVEQRKCRFPKESHLHISPIYSYNLCRMQCRMKLAYSLCSCIPWFYKPSEKYEVCDIKGMKCLAQHSEVLIKLVNDGKRVSCDCLPTCDDVNYVIESESMLDWTFGTNLRWELNKYPRERLIRDVIFGVTDVLVAMGGTAGFFFGCSVLSLVEILYFFTLRLFWYIVRKYQLLP